MGLYGWWIRVLGTLYDVHAWSTPLHLPLPNLLHPTTRERGTSTDLALLRFTVNLQDKVQESLWQAVIGTDMSRSGMPEDPMD